MKLLLKRFLSRFASPLPVGVTEFHIWADSIIELSGEYADRDSMKQALGNMVIHASPLKGTDTPRDKIPKHYFVKSLRKGAANQVASYIFQEIRTKQMAELEERKKAEIAAQAAVDEARSHATAIINNTEKFGEDTAVSDTANVTG